MTTPPTKTLAERYSQFNELNLKMVIAKAKGSIDKFITMHPAGTKGVRHTYSEGFISGYVFCHDRRKPIDEAVARVIEACDSDWFSELTCQCGFWRITGVGKQIKNVLCPRCAVERALAELADVMEGE